MLPENFASLFSNVELRPIDYLVLSNSELAMFKYSW